MEGRGFQKCVADGDYVHAGDVLLKMDLDAIRKEGLRDNNDDDSYNADDYDVENGFLQIMSAVEKK